MLFVCPVSSHMYNPTATGHVSPMHYTIQADYLCITKTILASASRQSISTRPVHPHTTLRHIHTHIYIYSSVHNPWRARKRARALLRTSLCFGEVFRYGRFARVSRALHIKAPDFAFAKLRACKAKQQPNRNPQLDNQNLTLLVC